MRIAHDHVVIEGWYHDYDTCFCYACCYCHYQYHLHTNAIINPAPRYDFAYKDQGSRPKDQQVQGPLFSRAEVWLGPAAPSTAPTTTTTATTTTTTTVNSRSSRSRRRRLVLVLS